MLPLGELESLALPGQGYKLAFTPGLLSQVFQRPRPGNAPEQLVADPEALLGGQAPDRGGYERRQTLVADGRFPASDAADHCGCLRAHALQRQRGGRSGCGTHGGARTLLPCPPVIATRSAATAHVTFDPHDLLLRATEDAIGNRVTADVHDYRVLQPALVSDMNRNRTAVAFDTLGWLPGQR